MANGDLVSQVDTLLDQGKISQPVASTLTLKLMKSVYEKLDDITGMLEQHNTRITNLEHINEKDTIERRELINWSWIRDKIVQPGVILFLGWFFFSFLPELLKSTP